MLLPTAAGLLVALAITVPLAWKWELGVRRVAIAVVLIGLAVSLAIALAGGADGSDALTAALVAGLTLAVAFAILAWRFYRDPERSAPGEPGLVVSPADGVVVYVRASREGRLPVATKNGSEHELQELTRTPLRARDAVVVGIAMSFLDVHVNRAPIAGHVTLRRHFPGKFGSLGQPEMVFENERATTVIERDGLQVAVVQIASRLVRQIASYVDVGEDVEVGQRIGVIRLGSQVDVVLPADAGLEVVVEVGERVRAGETILAHSSVAPATPGPSFSA